MKQPYDNIVILTRQTQLIWWFFVLALLTIYFKFNYIGSIYREGFSVAIDNYMQCHSNLEYIKVFSLVFLKSFAEISIFAILLYTILHKFMHLNLKIVIIITILLVMLIGAANQLSLQSVRSLLTYDSLMITFDWMKDNPNVINSYITKKNLVYFLLSIFISILPILLSTKHFQIRPIIWLNTLLSYIILVLIVISFLLYGFIGTFIKKDVNLQPLDGYWSSVTSSFIGGNKTSLTTRKVLSLQELKSNYQNLIYSNQHEEYKSSINVGKRHIIIIGLETAPEKYYPIVNNPKLKNFYQMSQSSIISHKHFTSTPYTFYASYSLLTGTYVPPEGSALIYGDMTFNGLGNILSKHNYISTYIDSYYVDWHAGSTHEKVINRLGFKNLFDRNDYDYKTKIKTLDSQYKKELYAETKSFEQVTKTIDSAVAQNKKSLIFLSTSLGHFNWKATKSHKNLTNKEKILELASVLDALLGNLLTSLKERNLDDDVIIAITGDHGLRYLEEYTSLNEKDTDLAVAFNVPLMIYIPNRLEKQITLNHATSHVDLTPTLLELVGIDTSKYFFHGDSILNPALKDRMIFTMNQSLKPESSFYKDDIFYSYNDLSAEAYSSNDKQKTEKKYIQDIIHNAKEQFNDLGAYNLNKN